MGFYFVGGRFQQRLLGYGFFGAAGAAGGFALMGR